jgi:hypothetical protein
VGNQIDKEVGDGYQKDQPESVVDSIDHFSGQNQAALPLADIFLVDYLRVVDVLSYFLVK